MMMMMMTKNDRLPRDEPYSGKPFSLYEPGS
jgi:hypothetical protein